MLLARRERPYSGTYARTVRTVCQGWVEEVVAGMVLPMDPSGMRARLMLAPWWVLALYYVVFFGVGMGLFTGIRESSVLGGVIGGLVEGLVFGAIMTPFTTRMRERMRVQMGGLSLERFRVARKSSWRGPLPSDLAVRADALVIAHEARRQAERFRWGGVGAVRRLPGPRDRARGHGDLLLRLDYARARRRRSSVRPLAGTGEEARRPARSAVMMGGVARADRRD